MERCGKEKYQNIGKKCVSLPGIEQENTEKITCGSSGPTGTVNLREEEEVFS